MHAGLTIAREIASRKCIECCTCNGGDNHHNLNPWPTANIRVSAVLRWIYDDISSGTHCTLTILNPASSKSHIWMFYPATSLAAILLRHNIVHSYQLSQWSSFVRPMSMKITTRKIYLLQQVFFFRLNIITDIPISAVTPTHTQETRI